MTEHDWRLALAAALYVLFGINFGHWLWLRGQKSGRERAVQIIDQRIFLARKEDKTSETLRALVQAQRAIKLDDE